MEIALAILAAAATFLAFSAWMAKGVEKERAQRLQDEVEALRRTARAGTLSETETLVGTSGIYRALAPEPSAAKAADLEPFRTAVRSLREALETRVGLSTPSGGGPSLEELRRQGNKIESAAAALLLRLDALELPAEEEPSSATVPARTASPEDGLGSSRATLEELEDETRRLRDGLAAITAASSRVARSAEVAAVSITMAERAADALAPFAGSLSSHADRVNLLALNIALLARENPGSARTIDEAGRELRTVCEEVRQLSRELASSAQRARDATRLAREAATEVEEIASEGQRRAEAEEHSPDVLHGLAERLAAMVDTIGRRLDALESEGQELTRRLSEAAAREAGTASRRDALRREIEGLRLSTAQLGVGVTEIHALIRVLPEPAPVTPSLRREEVDAALLQLEAALAAPH